MASQSLLCVEPDESALEIIKKALEPLGFTVTNFTNGEEAVAWARQNPPGLVIVSVEPRKVGYAICNKFKRSNELKDVPLILTSAEETPQQLEQHRKLKVKANEYLSKPFSNEELVARVRLVFPLDDADGGEGASDDIIISSDLMDEISIGDSDIVTEDAGADDAGAVHAEEEGLFDSGSTQAQNANDLEAMFDRETEAAFAAIRSPDEGPPAARAAASALRDEDLFDRSQPPTRAVPDADALGDFPASPRAGATVAVTSMPPSPDEFSVAPDSVFLESVPTPPVDEEEPSAGRRTTPMAAALDPEILGKLARTEEFEKELARTRKELEELKARPQSPASGRDRELLALREIINKKDKDLLDLQDALHSKERQILDHKDRSREHERERRNLEESALGFEKGLMAANERIEAMTSDKDKATEREKSLKTRLEDAHVEITKSHEEVDALKRRTAAAEERLRGDLDRLRGELEGRIIEMEDAQRQAVERAGEERATAEAAIEQFHQGELGQLKEGHAAALAVLQKKADEERAAAESQAQADLNRQRREHEQALASAKEEQARQIAAEREALQTALEAKERDHKNEILGMRRRHEDELAAAEERRGREQAEAETQREAELGAADERRRAELKQRDEEHRTEVAELDRKNFQEKTALSERHRNEADQMLGRAAMAEGELAARSEELSEANRRLQGVAADLDTARSELRDKEVRLAQSQTRVNGLESKVGEYEEQIMRAYQRLKGDDQVIGRAKRALAVALSLLEERGAAGGAVGAAPEAARSGDTDESATKERAT